MSNQKLRFQGAWKGADEVSVEHTLAKFLGDEVGKRGESYDADFIRGGSVSSFGETLIRCADRVIERLNWISLDPLSSQNSRARALIEFAAKDLKSLGTHLASLKDEREPFDPMWSLAGSLFQTIDGLFELLDVSTG